MIAIGSPMPNFEHGYYVFDSSQEPIPEVCRCGHKRGLHFISISEDICKCYAYGCSCRRLQPIKPLIPLIQQDEPKVLKAEDTLLQELMAFEAGREAGKAECAKTHFKPKWELTAQELFDMENEAFEAGRRAERKEVVNFVEEKCDKIGMSYIQPYRTIDFPAWQAWKKERGIE